MKPPDLSLSPQQRVQFTYPPGHLPLHVQGKYHSAPKNQSFSHHWHEEIELLYNITGRMTCCVNEKEYELQDGEGIFINVHQLHAVHLEDSADCDLFHVLLNPVLLCSSAWIEQQYIFPLTNNRKFRAMALKRDVLWQDELLDQLLHIKNVYERKDAGYGLELQGCSYLLCLSLFQNMPDEFARQTQKDPNLYALKQMMLYIEQNVQQKITLTDIASAGCVCASICCRMFRKYLNCTPMDYLTKCRLQLGCDLLRESDFSITDIAYRIGFSGPSYFAERFRQKYGCSPREFRARWENADDCSLP